MCRMVLREFNIPLCYRKLPRLKKNNFQNFFKKIFDFINFSPAEFERPPVSQIFPRPSKIFFADFGRKFHDFTISIPVFLIYAGWLIFCNPLRDLSWRVLIVCADLLRIAGILHKCRIYRCAGLVS